MPQGDSLNMLEMQFFLSLYAGGAELVCNRNSVVVNKIRDKLGEGVVKTVDGLYILGDIPGNMSMDLIGAEIKPSNKER